MNDLSNKISFTDSSVVRDSSRISGHVQDFLRSSDGQTRVKAAMNDAARTGEAIRDAMRVSPAMLHKPFTL